ALAAEFVGGKFATIYLSPRDYHRVHMPLAGTLRRTVYVPGQLFSVNQATADNVAGLFARNERLVCIFDTEVGPMAVVLVGAMIVAGIETVWSGQVAPPPKNATVTHYDRQLPEVKLARGAELGRFKLGSTAIVLFPPDTMQWRVSVVRASSVRMGSAIARCAPALPE